MAASQDESDSDNLINSDEEGEHTAAVAIAQESGGSAADAPPAKRQKMDPKTLLADLKGFHAKETKAREKIISECANNLMMIIWKEQKFVSLEDLLTVIKDSDLGSVQAARRLHAVVQDTNIPQKVASMVSKKMSAKRREHFKRVCLAMDAWLRKATESPGLPGPGASDEVRVDFTNAMASTVTRMQGGVREGDLGSMSEQQKTCYELICTCAGMMPKLSKSPSGCGYQNSFTMDKPLRAVLSAQDEALVRADIIAVCGSIPRCVPGGGHHQVGPSTGAMYKSVFDKAVKKVTEERKSGTVDLEWAKKWEAENQPSSEQGAASSTMSSSLMMALGMSSK